MPIECARSKPAMQPRACAARAMRARSNAWPVRNCTPGHSTSAISCPCAREALLDALLAASVARPARGASSSSSSLGVESVPGDLRGDRVAVGGEGARFDEDAAARPARTVEARQHQVQVHRERVHGDDFARVRPGERRQPRGQVLVIRHPRPPRLLVPEHGEARPVVELGADDVAGGERLQAERVAAQVNERARRAHRTAARSARAARAAGRRRRAPAPARASATGSCAGGAAG